MGLENEQIVWLINLIKENPEITLSIISALILNIFGLILVIRSNRK